MDFLKILSIWQVIANVLPGVLAAVKNPGEIREAVSHEVGDTITALVSTGHLPKDFRKGLGNLVNTVIDFHPSIPPGEAPTPEAFASPAIVNNGVTADNVQAMMAKNNQDLLMQLAGMIGKPAAAKSKKKPAAKPAAPADAPKVEGA